MKLKIGDRVKIIRIEEEFGRLLGATGTIIDIDEWEYPYEIKYDDMTLHLEAEAGILPQLFTDEDLQLLVPIETKEDASYISIKFQEGTVLENGVNGVQIEDVINLLVDRLVGFQKYSSLPCRENALAITKLEEARMWLNERTRKRNEQGVEGKNKNHE